MACTSALRQGQTLAERMAEVTRALKELELKIAAGAVKVAIGQNGAVALTGWSAADRSGVSDACAVRALMLEGSMVLRLALQRAELLSGRKMNVNAVASGVHSHDGGRTWHGGH